jgi:hypothetical protein
MLWEGVHQTSVPKVLSCGVLCSESIPAHVLIFLQVVSIPQSLVESLLWSVIVYWVRD